MVVKIKFVGTAGCFLTSGSICALVLMYQLTCSGFVFYLDSFAGPFGHLPSMNLSVLYDRCEAKKGQSSAQLQGIILENAHMPIITMRHSPPQRLFFQRRACYYFSI